MGIEGVLEQGFATTTADKLINWLTMADELRSRVLRRRDDARRGIAL